ncbi:cobalt-precorrin-8X methylmutase [Planktothrix sp. FACHB-1355]|uniref:Cobalt-precorrin-8X methylmutase n=1 Tax=Aerosakkonema funiforme FACHB-1375 TaxID=2949571 RepID=A0A926VI38_9CYAN|nr:MULTISPECIES: cobalt-precorrin-8X methylmutase [Oscillatoriales]MBD2183044.1 cobalt-precorrin-8X methylmutase [Aerosakkonema funiforme FACHB-1375]MBD3557772.1 cobalt-precorrin-8X methylmutase [Planktothrix sp. FACHB-1355]
MSLPIHPIMEQSFAVIDREIGSHNFNPAEYAIVRRVIHSSADFEFKHLIRFSPEAIAAGIAAIRSRVPIVTDVGMVKQGVAGLVGQTFGNPLISAVEKAKEALPGKTRTETGLLQCWQEFPAAIFAIGNAPTALLALCTELRSTSIQPALVIGAPVGFISVVESKAVLAQTPVPQIRIEGRKGGSTVTAAIVNALIVLAWEQESSGIENFQFSISD